MLTTAGADTPSGPAETVDRTFSQPVPEPGDGPSHEPARGPRTGRAWWIAFAVFWLVGALWSYATPLFSVPDEHAHTIRAAAVARGQILPGEKSPRAEGRLVEVPDVYHRAVDVPLCYGGPDDTTAGCEARFSGSDELAMVETTAGTYPPTYYLLVGLPSLLTSSSAGVDAMRLLTAGLGAALLASAVAALWGLRCRLLAVAAVGLAVTPKAAYLLGSVNPNALEAAAAVCFWASLVALLGAAPGRRSRLLLLQLAVSGVLLASSRPSGPLWVALAVLVAALWAGRRPVLDMLRDRRAWPALGTVGVTSVATVGWVVAYGAVSSVPGFGPKGGGFGENVRTAASMSLGWFVNLFGVHGAEGYDEEFTILPVYLWVVAAGALLMLALALAPRSRETLALVLLALAVVVAPILLQLPQASEQAFPWQGRYTLPIFAGVPILAAVQLDRSRLLPDRLVRNLGTLLIAVVVIGQALAYVLALRRFEAGADVLTPG